MSDLASVTILARGELDIASAPQLRKRVRERLDQLPQALTIDLAGVTFLDCAGLSTLIWALNTARWAGVGFSVARPSRAVHRLLALTDTRDQFSIIGNGPAESRDRLSKPARSDVLQLATAPDSGGIWLTVPAADQRSWL